MKTLMMFFVMAAISQLHAQWVQMNGPYGGDVLSIAVLGSNVFASANGNIYRSTNDGASWSAANSGLPHDSVFCLAASGTNIFAGTWGKGVFLSTDRGESWMGRNNGLTDSTIQCFAFSDTDIFVGTGRGVWPPEGRVFRSPDNGASWIPASNGLPNGIIYTLASAYSKVFVGGLFDMGSQPRGLLFASTDNGLNWDSSSTGLTNYPVYALAMLGEALFAGSPSGVFRSTNRGLSWTRTNNGLENKAISTFAVSDAGIFAGADGDGVFRSPDTGATWIPSNNGLAIAYVHCLGVSGSSLFAGGFRSVAISKSADNGANWTAANTGLTTSRIVTLAPADTKLFAATYGDGIYCSTDNGMNWLLVALADTIVHSSTFVRSSWAWSNGVGGTTLVVGCNGFIIRSQNSGESWAVTMVDPSTSVTAFARGGGYVFAGTYHGILRSTDDGITWVLSNTGLTDPSVKSLAISGVDVFVGTYGGRVFRSTNNGTSWTSIGQLSDTVLSLTVSNGAVYAGTNSGAVYRTSNNGTSWTGGSIAVRRAPINALTVSDSNVLAGMGDGTVLLSTDNGSSWSDISTGLRSSEVSALQVVGTDVFVGTDGAGVWRRPLSEIITGVEDNSTLPTKYELEQNYPNPFNPTTTISFSIPHSSIVTLKVFDVLGREVATLADGIQYPGHKSVQWDATDIASGIYFYRLQVGSFMDTKKLLLLR